MRRVAPRAVAATIIAVLATLIIAWQVALRLGIVGGTGEDKLFRPGDVAACGPAWRVVQGPNPSKDYNELHAMSATAPNNIWAVGTLGTEDFALTFITRWNGIGWNQMPSPSIPEFSNHLYGVSALPGGDAWAVGASHRGTDDWHTLAMRWEGSKWNIVSTPNVAQISALNAVAALSAEDAWAVGESSTGSKGTGSRALIEHWNGHEWSIVLPPNTPPNSTLSTIAALSGNNIWAAGSYSDKSGTLDRPLVLHYDGKGWSTAPTGDAAGALWSIAAIANDNVWAVGNNGPQSLTMHWDGTRWSVVPSPNPRRGSNSLNSVAANGPNDVWAAGSSGGGGSDRTMSIHWDGTRWNAIPIPTTGDYSDTINSVAALPNGDVWAVGSTIADTHGTNLAVIEKYSDPCR